MFERFTERARTTVTTAVATAHELHHGTAGTDHVVVALAADPDSSAGSALAAAGLTWQRARELLVAAHRDGSLGPGDADALEQIGIDLTVVRERVESTFGPGALAVPEPSGALRRTRGRVTGEARKSLELALREALRLRHDYIGTEHLLLGLIRSQGSGYGVLVAAGVDIAALRARVEEAAGSQRM